MPKSVPKMADWRDSRSTARDNKSCDLGDQAGEYICRYGLVSPRVILCQRPVVKRFCDLFRSHVVADKHKVAQIFMMPDVPWSGSAVVYNVRPICVDMRISRYRLIGPRVIPCQSFVNDFPISFAVM